MAPLKQLILSFCFASLAAGIGQLLLPAGHFQKIANTIIGIFLIACFISSFSGSATTAEMFNFSQEHWEPDSTLASQTGKVLEKAAVTEATSLIDAAADQAQVPIQILSIQTDCTQLPITIQEVTLVVEGTREQAQKVQNVLQNSMDATLCVQWTGGNQNE